MLKKLFISMLFTGSVFCASSSSCTEESKTIFDIIHNTHLSKAEKTTELSSYLAKNPQVICIQLAHKGSLGVDGSEILASALTGNNTIGTFYLWDNDIGADGIKHFARMLSLNTTLDRVAIDANSIGDSGAQALADALKKNNTLSYLSVFNNGITDPGALALAGMLKVNRGITYLNIVGNSFSDYIKEDLSKMEGKEVLMDSPSKKEPIERPELESE